MSYDSKLILSARQKSREIDVWVLVSLASAASVPVSISADEPEQEVSLRYKYLPGELLEYQTRITWQFDQRRTPTIKETYLGGRDCWRFKSRFGYPFARSPPLSSQFSVQHSTLHFLRRQRPVVEKERDMSRRNGLLLLLQQMRLAPSAVTFLAVALSMQLAVCIGSQRLDTAQCIGDTGGLVTVKGGKDGRLVVQRSGGLLEAFDASGGKLWSVNLTSDHRLSVYAFGVTNDNDVLVVGVTYDTSEAVLYRVSNDGRRVERVRTYPKMRLCDVSVAPSGAVYLLALSNAIVLDMFHSATHGEVLNQPETVTQLWLHRLNDNGEIVQSSHSIEIPTRSWQEAYDYMSDLQTCKLFFSPAGKPYILDPNKSSFMIADLGSDYLPVAVTRSGARTSVRFSKHARRAGRTRTRQSLAKCQSRVRLRQDPRVRCHKAVTAATERL